MKKEREEGCYLSPRWHMGEEQRPVLTHFNRAVVNVDLREAYRLSRTIPPIEIRHELHIAYTKTHFQKLREAYFSGRCFKSYYLEANFGLHGCALWVDFFIDDIEILEEREDLGITIARVELVGDRYLGPIMFEEERREPIWKRRGQLKLLSAHF